MIKEVLKKLKYPIIGALIVHAATRTGPGKNYTRFIERTVD